MLAHLLKYDSTQGKYAKADTVDSWRKFTSQLMEKKITIYAEADASKLPWGDLGVDVVLECTGFYTSKAKAEAHVNCRCSVRLLSQLQQEATFQTIVLQRKPRNINTRRYGYLCSYLYNKLLGSNG